MGTLTILIMMTLLELPIACEDAMCPPVPQKCYKKEKVKPLFPGDEGYLGDGLLTNKDGESFGYGYGNPVYPLSVYSKVKFRIRTEKSTYKLGEKILIAQYIWNASDIVLNVQQTSIYFFGINDIKVTNSAGEEMPLTEKGKKNMEVTSLSMIYSGGAVKFIAPLTPNEVMKTRCDCPISDLFDMSKQDTYEITFYRWSVIHGQKYDKPLKSNTLRIIVTDAAKPSAE